MKRKDIIILLSATLIVASLSLILLPDGGGDYHRDIAPAARVWWDAPWLHGLPQAPYLALLYYPSSLLPDQIASALLNALSVVIIGLIIKKEKGPLWLLAPILISPFGFWLFKETQTDALIMIGLLLPAGWGLPLLILKPQTAIWGIVPGFRKTPTWIYFVPVGLVLGLSLIIWGLWPLEIAKHYSEVLISAPWNSSVWPWGIPFGIGLIISASRRKHLLTGAAASPLLFPYVNVASWLPFIIWLLLKRPRAGVLIWGVSSSIAFVALIFQLKISEGGGD